MASYAERKNVDIKARHTPLRLVSRVIYGQALRFFFDGNRIHDDHTPADLGEPSVAVIVDQVTM